MADRDWTPIRVRGVYCSPACGRGCTSREHENAMKCAKSLAEWIGEGYKPVVWENLGWHYRAESPCGRIKVHPSSGGYNAFLGRDSSAGGEFVGTGKTPKAAIQDAVRQVREMVVVHQEFLDALALN